MKSSSIAIKYDEYTYKFRDLKSREEFIGKIEAKAVEVVKPFSFVERKKTVRGVLYRTEHPWYPGEVGYWIVWKPRAAEPHVWFVAIKDFALCDLDDGARARHSLVVKDKLYALCEYHSRSIVYGKDNPLAVIGKIKSVPDDLCRVYCPQYFGGFCKVWMPAYDIREVTRRGRAYRGMKILCLEDDWWRRFWID